MCTYHLSVDKAKLVIGGDRRTETILVKNPEDREILGLVEMGLTNPGAQSNGCTAPPGCRCPYRRYTTSPQRTAHVETLSTEITPQRRGEDGELMELVDLDCMYPEARRSECAAPPSYRCTYRQYDAALPAAQSGVLSQSESGLSHSQPLRLTPKGNRLRSGKRTDDLCPLTYSRDFSQPPEL